MKSSWMNKLGVVIILALISFNCCLASELDYSKLIKDYDPKQQEQFLISENLTPPYGALFSTGNKSLLYLAVRHAFDVKSKTGLMIKYAIVKFHPDLIIVEGLNSESEHRGILDYIYKNYDIELNCPENLYAIYIAARNNISFIGGEIDDEEVFKSMSNIGYSKHEVIYFYFTQYIPQLYREKKINSLADIEKFFDKRIASYKLKPSFSSYKKWLSDHKIPTLYKQLIDNELTAPIIYGNYLQKLSSKIARLRNQHIFQLVMRLSQANNKVMVIYGHSHFLAHKDVLTYYLGKPYYLRNNYDLKKVF